ncbi:patatin-like phospholipase family protein [Nocardia aurantiaca]|uniref:Patatin-like phospholipase family protein n=1 Tax=Nocardia aurantiaca TaxID=2675850 RepID=A0A6I3KZI4_9NOCA|nr:patatin-like phospholipase family protein [Nocardia aurantiaca]MTE15037.1 patatin-like phospholipase family protein [Nocardia aurantiaca]
MPATVPPNGTRHALVLGGGGAVGIVWMAGLTLGLRDAGIDLGRADRIVGTSAGAVVGANIAAGVDPGTMLVTPSPNSEAPPIDASGLMEILAMRPEPGESLADQRRRVGARALEMNVGDPADHLARMGRLLGVTEWPDRDLIVTAVDVTTGELEPWTRDGRATLLEAIASSTSVPGVFPPIPIGGTYYIDGGMRSPINADLAAGADLILVLEPLAHMFPHAPSDSELGGATAIFVTPDADALAVFGPDVFDRSALEPAFAAGVRQAAEAATRLKGVWPGA